MVAASCGKQSDSGAYVQEVEIRLLPWFEDFHWIDPLLERFHQTHPGIRVKKLQASQEEETLRTLIAAGDPPDVFAISYEALDTYRAAGALQPLDPYLASGGFDAGAFFPRTLDALRRDGALYGLPKDCTPYVFFYDVGAFDDAGLTRPEPAQWTWDTLRDYARRLTKTTADGEVLRYGVRCNLWAQAFLPFVWQAGGDLLGADGTRSAFGEAPAVEALTFVAALRADGSHPPFAQPEVHASPRYQFGRGTIAMVGPTGRWTIQGLRDQHPDCRYDVLPLPTGPAGVRDTALAMTAYCVSSQSAEKDAAVTLLQFLAGEDGARFMGELGRAVPAVRSVADEVLAADAANMPRHGREVFADGLERLRIAESGGVHYAEIKQAVTDAIESALLSTSPTPPAEAVAHASAAIDGILARDREVGARPSMPWRAILVAVGGLWVAALSALIWRQRASSRMERAHRRAALGFVSPWLIGFSAFVLLPIALVVALSFSDWNALSPVGDARFVGLAQFERLLTDPMTARALEVTGWYALIALPTQLVVSLGLALLLHRAGRWLGVMRTVVYLPSLIAGVAMSVLWWRLFDADGGLLNDTLRGLGLGGVPWLLDERAVVPSFVLMSLWYVGGTVVVFLTGLAGVPRTLLEAARIDGAGPLRRLWHVTLPSIAPLIVFNAITLMIGSFQTFTQAFVLTKGGPNNASLFYVLQLYRTAFQYQEMGYACAMAVLLFAVVGALTAVMLRLSRRWVHA